MKPSLIYPASPFKVTQAWGVKNNAYLQFGFSLHNGVDFLLDTDKTLVAPHEGVVSEIGYQPTGAGNYLCIRSKYPYEFPEGNLYMTSVLMHLEKCLVKAGDTVKPGDKVAIGDNTGFSTGPHTHWAFYREKLMGSKYQRFDQNDANNTIDPLPYVELSPEQEARYLTIIEKIKAIIEILRGQLPK